MPLAFESLSHGTIAFGFFNIESDMLLCDRCFLFADDFCRHVGDLAENCGLKPCREFWQVQLIESPEDIGDLMGAIHGVRFTGLIGELYRRFPFPDRPEDFKQNPEGFKTRPVVEQLIAGYARQHKICVEVPAGGLEIDLGGYRFSREHFQQLIKYVWRGGYPRWKDEIRPTYVTEMKAKIMHHRRGLFEDMDFEEEEGV
jgi:hypothetical protein